MSKYTKLRGLQKELSRLNHEYRGKYSVKLNLEKEYEGIESRVYCTIGGYLADYNYVTYQLKQVEATLKTYEKDIANQKRLIADEQRKIAQAQKKQQEQEQAQAQATTKRETSQKFSTENLEGMKHNGYISERTTLTFTGFNPRDGIVFKEVRDGQVRKSFAIVRHAYSSSLVVVTSVDVPSITIDQIIAGDIIITDHFKL